jgi:hypothetical protein
MMTIVDVNTDSGYGFVPVVRSLDPPVVEVKLVQVTEKASKISVLKDVESKEIKVGAQQQMGNGLLEVQVLAITRDIKNQIAWNARVTSRPYFDTGQCCVTCYDQRTCLSCTVITDCGCCCTPAPHCCICPKTT